MTSEDMYWMWGSNDNEFQEHVLYQENRGQV